MKIKTLHITNSFHSSSGGVSTFYRAMIRAAERLKRPMRLVVPSDAAKVEEVGDYAKIHYIPAPRSPIFDPNYRLITPSAYLPLFQGSLRQVLSKEQPDLVEVCDKYSVNWLAGLLRKTWISGLNRPVLVGLSCERMDDNLSAYLARNNAGRSWSKYYLGSLYIPLFDYHIANSEYTAAELRDSITPRHERDIHVLPMGAEVDDFRQARGSAEVRRRLVSMAGGGEGTRLLLYAGRLSPEKNLPLLIETMTCLARNDWNDYRLIVAGAGPLEDWMRSEAAKRFPDRMLMLGHISDRRELIDLYANCDVFVHPNPREPFGISPLEAMAAGLPLVAPKSGGLLSYADGTNSWLADPRGVSFADAVREVFDNPSERRDRLARARWRSEQYRWQAVTERFFKLYDRLFLDFPQTRFARKLKMRRGGGMILQKT